MIHLSPDHTFTIERYEKRLRLIVYKNGEEYVCRKESLGKLKKALATDDARIFKGRLQLLKHGDDIAVEIKRQPVGTISVSSFQNCLESLS